MVATRPAQRRRRSPATIFSLPGELRNKIYRLELVKNSTIMLDADQLELLEQGDPALLRCHDKVKQECHRIYFEENTFCFTNQSLNDASFSIFCQAMGNAFQNLQQIKICRSYQIGDMKPIVIAFRAHTQTTTERGRTRTKILIERPRDEKMPFPGIRSKMRGKFQEPCRCEVDAIARSWQLPEEPCGLLLLEFLNEYIDRINLTTKTVEIEVCKKCNSVRRV